MSQFELDQEQIERLRRYVSASDAQYKEAFAAWDKERAEKDKKIAELQESFAMSQAARKEWMAVFDGYKLTILQQQQRLSEARFLIERIGTVAIGQGTIILAAEKWLKKPI